MGSLAPRLLKAFLGLILWGLFVFWVAEWFIYPTDRYTSWKADAIERTNTKFYELNGPFFLMWSFPVIMFALFALLYIEVDKHIKREPEAKVVPKWKQVYRRLNRGLWSSPILVKTPLGVLTGMDLLAISLVTFATLWILFKPLIPMLELVDKAKMKPGIERWMIKVGRVGTWTGRAWYLPMALLFIPVSRNSPFLRLVNFPFEHAVRFHRWLGHFSLVILLLHSITFALHVYYTGGGSMKGVYEWANYGVSNMAGIISMVAGLVLWVTSLGPIRQYFFDVFYITHHMYILVFAFGVWHIGDFSSFFFMAGVMLYFIDRFIRMVQSQRPVSILSARVLPSGVVELKFPKSPELKYSALGFIFINIPGVSRFQWHPFSATSSSLQGDDITLCIKPLGEWTQKLQRLVMDADSSNPKGAKSGGCPLSLQLFAEGPYGPEREYFLDYKTLILVAGGVGITPFLAVIRDLLCRYQNEAKFSEGQELPSEVHLIWCVPRKADLATLRELQPFVLFPGFAGGPLKIDVKAFVTREQPGHAKLETMSNDVDKVAYVQGREYAVFNNVDEGVSRQKAVWDVRGSNLWMAAVITVAMGGFLLFHGIFHNYVVRPNHHTHAPFYFEHGAAHGAHGPAGKPFPTWATVSLMFISMVIGVVVFGGAVLFAWSKFGTRSRTAASPQPRSRVGGADLETNAASLLEEASISEGSRPNLAELLNAVTPDSVGHDVGVLVSGPVSMLEDVAGACRGYNFRNICGGTQLQYHSISFDF